MEVSQVLLPGDGRSLTEEIEADMHVPHALTSALMSAAGRGDKARLCNVACKGP